MVIPIKYTESVGVEEERAMRDLARNANSNDYMNEKGFKQKYIDTMYKLGYYKDNESVFSGKVKERRNG